MNKLVLIAALCLLFLSNTVGQDTREEKADSLATIAMQLMDEGEIDHSIELLKQSKELFNKWLYDYEIGLALYMKEDFAGAQKIFKRVLRRDGTDPLQYKMLGNTYSVHGDREKAIKTYLKGLKKFPDAGSLYLELGVVERAKENHNEALLYWEKGIEADPFHASNYYWAAKYFSATSEQVWALLYGEMFLNLEFNTARSQEISALLFDVYNDVYEAESDTSGKFSLTQSGHQINISIDQLKEATKSPEKLESLLKLPFESAYSLAMAPGAIHYTKTGIDLEGLHNLRAAFIDFWIFQDTNKQDDYPFVLFPFHAQMMEQGLFVYYNYFLMREGSPKEFEEFFNENEIGFNRFFEWYDQNHLPFKGHLHSRLQM